MPLQGESETVDLVRQLVARVDALTAEIRQLRERLPSPLVTVREASRVPGVSVSTIKRKVRSREIPSRHVGRSLRVDISLLSTRVANDNAGSV